MILNKIKNFICNKFENRNEIYEIMYEMKILTKKIYFLCRDFHDVEIDNIRERYEFYNILGAMYYSKVTTSDYKVGKDFPIPLMYSSNYDINLIKISLGSSYVLTNYDEMFEKKLIFITDKYIATISKDVYNKVIITNKESCKEKITNYQVLKDVKDFNEKLNKTSHFYKIVNKLIIGKIGRININKFVKKYKENKEMLNLLVVCSKQNTQHELLNVMYNNNVDFSLENISTLLEKIEYSKKVIIPNVEKEIDKIAKNISMKSIRSIREREKTITAINNIKKDMKDNTYSFTFLNSFNLSKKLECNLSTNKTTTRLQRAKI